MTDSATASPAITTSSEARRTVTPPPGLFFGLVTIAAILLGLAAHLNQSLMLLLVTIPVWLILAGSWLLRVAIAVLQSSGRMPAGHWARWLAVPVVMGLVFGLTQTTLLLDARFQASRGDLDAMASDISAGGSLDRGWVGLYEVGTADRTANGFWFVIDDAGLGRWGIAYSRDGEPDTTDANLDEGTWSGAWFEHIEGPWWIFQQTWD